MAFLGGIIPANVVGIDRPDLRRLREREERLSGKGAQSFKRAMDEAELSAVPAVDASEPVHDIKHNDTEEGHEDRAEHGFYDASGQPMPGRRIDVAG